MALPKPKQRLNVSPDLPHGSAYLNVATKLVREAGRVFLEASRDIARITVLSKQPLYTSVNQQVEQSIRQGLIKTYPEHTIRCAYGSLVNQAQEFTWQIEAIDGTVNVMRGLPLCCIALGLTYAGHPMLSVIYHPITDQLFTALRGHGARFNYKRLRIQPRKYTTKTLVAVLASAPLLALLPEQYDYRNLGSTFLHFCYAAAGQVDLVMSTADQLHPHLAIPRLILEEAGGVILNLDAGELFEAAGRYVAGPWAEASALHKLITAKPLP